MPKFVLDTVVLRVFAFAHSQGIDILLGALATAQACFPAEVYNQDEALSLPDDHLSELAKGLRYARRQAQTQPGLKGQQYQRRLDNALQILHHLQAGSLLIEPLDLEELPQRENIKAAYGIGTGEAACLVLARRDTLTAIFLSSDHKACEAAQALGIDFLTIPGILIEWMQRAHPDRDLLQALIEGMRQAAFQLPDSFYQQVQLNFPELSP